MKRFVALSIILTAIIMSIFSYALISKSEDPKVAAFNKSIEHSTLGDNQKAFSELEKIYEKNKENYLINLRLGWLAFILNDFDKSESYYRNAVRISNSSIESQLGLTYPLSAKNNWEEIKKIYKNILKVDSENYFANLGLGQIALSETNYNEAKKYLEKVFKSYPGEYSVNLSLGWTYYYLGNSAKAKELLTNVLMLSKDDASALEGLNLLK